MLKQHWLVCVSSQASDVAVSIIFFTLISQERFFVFALQWCDQNSVGLPDVKYIKAN